MKKEKGVSLVELLVVITLIGIIVIMIANLSSKGKNRWDLRGISREITATYYELKQRAARENLPCRMSFSRDAYTTWGCVEAAGVRSWVKLRDISIGTSYNVFIHEGGGFPDFAIDSRGMIYTTSDASPIVMTLAGIQTIELRSPMEGNPLAGDKFVISLYPIGGIHVESFLAQAF
jgi:prepilin-type N-terminal cleavage/methylation domain-containing protein